MFGLPVRALNRRTLVSGIAQEVEQPRDHDLAARERPRRP